jgi:hypothetical protein
MEQMIEQAALDSPDYVDVLIDGVTTWNHSDSLLGAEAFVIPGPLSKKHTQSRFMVKISTDVWQWSLDLQLRTTNCKARLLIILILI